MDEIEFGGGEGDAGGGHGCGVWVVVWFWVSWRVGGLSSGFRARIRSVKSC